MNNRTKYIQTKLLIYKCFNINKSIPKGYGIKSEWYKHWYNQKTTLLKLIISNIQNYNLKIKYGYAYSNDILYFCFDGEQFSFHGNYGSREKEYNGNWIANVRKDYVLDRKGKIIGEKYLYKRSLEISADMLDE